MIRKVTAVADVMRFIPPLHSLALNIAKRLQTIESAIPQHYLLEARVRTEAFRTLLLRVELKHPHVDADLDFFRAVARGDPTRDEFIGIKGPRVEQVPDVISHIEAY